MSIYLKLMFSFVFKTLVAAERFSSSWWSVSSLFNTSTALNGIQLLRKSLAIISNYIIACSFLRCCLGKTLLRKSVLLMFMANIIECPCSNVVLNSNIFKDLWKYSSTILSFRSTHRRCPLGISSQPYICLFVSFYSVVLQSRHLLLEVKSFS